MVFDLKSKITGFIPRDKFMITAKMYELKYQDIPIENPFS